MKNWGCTRIVALVAAIGLLTACGESADVDDTATCGDNEIVVDSACCLDINDNGVCDVDETEMDCEENENFVDGLCCVDEDENGVCDADECASDESYVDGECCVDEDENGICDSEETDDECAADEALVDGECCVDENANGICDSEETDDECAADEILVDGECCVDENANGICDDDETAEDCDDLTEIFVDGMCCEDLDGDELCDDDPADSCFGLDNDNDADNDGFCADVDCDDNNALIYPGAPELCGFHAVNDCDNPCYAAADASSDRCNDAGTFHEIKEGLVGERDDETGTWRDATDEVSGTGVVYDAEGQKTLYFCGTTDDTASEVDIRAAGADTILNLTTGIAQVPALIGSKQNQPVLRVSHDATLALRDMVVAHDELSGATEAHGLKCEGATARMNSTVVFTRNSATEGGAIYAEKCRLASSQSLLITDNHAKIGGGVYLSNSVFEHGRSHVELSANSAAYGAAMYLTNASRSNSTQGQIRVLENTVENAGSAALHLVGASIAAWSSSISLNSDGYVFKKNLSPNNVALDIVVSDASELDVSAVNFEPPNVGHVSTDQNDYAVTPQDADLVCDDTTCTF